MVRISHYRFMGFYAPLLLVIFSVFLFSGCGPTIKGSVKEDVSRTGESGRLEAEGLHDIPGLRDWHIIRVIYLKKLEQAAVLSFGEEVLTSVFRAHLKLETNALLRRILRGLPAGPGTLSPASG